MQILKRTSLILLLLSIIIAAHPHHTIQPFQDPLWRILYSLGIDIAMTPITNDMMLMWDKDRRIHSYKTQMRLHLSDFEGKSYTWLGKDLDFYFLRIPLLLMIEYEREGAPLEGFVSAICRNIAKSFGIKIKFWSLENSQDEEFSIRGQCPL